ncbi:MAG: vWA domain-containing protein [Pirellula sp.]|jgi:Ca-activated chloride channel family protein
MVESFRFQSWFFLAAIPIVVSIVLWSNRKLNRPRVIFSSIDGLEQCPVTAMTRLRGLLPWLSGLGMVLLTIGLARPQWGKSESRISGDGIAIQLAIDISGSMEAIDFQIRNEDVDRLSAVKEVVKEFILGSTSNGLKGRRDDSVGLVAFGGFADSKCPLTLDHGALIDIVSSLEIPRAVRDRRGRVINEQSLQEELATAIGDGLALSISQLKESKAKSKVVILLTDGDNNAGVVDPKEAAAIAKELGIKVYTIGIGKNGIVRIPREDDLGRRILVPAQFRVDEKLLREIADITGGIYFNAADSQGLTDVYAKIDALEKSQLEETKYSQYHELYPWFVMSGLLLLGLVHGLNTTRFRSLT